MKFTLLLATLLVATSAYADTQTIQTQGPATVTVSSEGAVAKKVARKHHHKPAPVAPVAQVPANLLPASSAVVAAAPAPMRAEEPAAVKPRKWALGAEVGNGSYVGGSGNISGVDTHGLLGSYQLDSHWGIRGDLNFSNFDLSNPTSSTTTTSSQAVVPNSCRVSHHGGRINCSYQNVSSSSTSYGDATASYSQTDFSVGPTYRILNSAFSPIVGLALDYTHRYYNMTYSGSAAPGNVSGNSDSLSWVGLVGVDYRLADNLSIGADVRYFTPMSTTTDAPTGMALGDMQVENQSSYTGTVNLQFHF